MAMRVRHLRDPQNGAKTLCGREATYRYRFTDVDTVRQNPMWLSCDRCRQKAHRLGLIPSQPPRPAAQPRPSEAVQQAGVSTVDTGDKEFNDYLARIGILNYS